MSIDTHAELVQQALAWAEAFAVHVRNRDFESALPMFSAAVHSYGTRAVEVHSLDELKREQWAPTWLRTRGFHHLPDSLDTQVSLDGSMAVICARWASEGVDTPESKEQQEPYKRSGRCTYVLTRAPDGRWTCSHTHFSLDPGSNQG